MSALQEGRALGSVTPSPRLSALVVTVVHHPADSRIRHRQIEALLGAGWQVTYAAPFRAFGLDPVPVSDGEHGGRLRHVDLPRSQGRRRLRADLAARQVLHQLGGRHDVVVVHDPELVLAAAGVGLSNLVWDVHEDPAAALQVKAWMPRLLRRPVAAGWRRLERLAERRHRLLLAEHAYQRRFRRSHPVVPNSVPVPSRFAPASGERVSYLGTVTMSRGCATMVAVGRELRRRTAGAVTLEVIGPAADAAAEETLRRAVADGVLSWLGFLRSDEALARVSGSLAGLCLLKDLPNFSVSLPTKIVEYCALGVPVITTPLPLAAELVRDHEVGVVVPWDDAAATVDAVLRLRSDASLRLRLGANGHEVAAREHDWKRRSQEFVEIMGELARTGR
jgi:glycosyltransferase involved in cell wall biosynthesis